jgi:dihydropyrimidinase
VVIDYGLHMTLLDPDPLILAQVPEAYDQGCATFKLYTAYPHFYLTDDELYRALRAVAEAGGLAVVHAENYPVITEVWKRLLAEGKVEATWHPHSRPAVTEAEAVNRVLSIAHLVGAPALIFHLSCGEAAREVAYAKERGWAAFGETCPQYLTLPVASRLFVAVRRLWPCGSHWLLAVLTLFLPTTVRSPLRRKGMGSRTLP